jgi:hypothetical protein
MSLNEVVAGRLDDGAVVPAGLLVAGAGLRAVVLATGRREVNVFRWPGLDDADFSGVFLRVSQDENSNTSERIVVMERMEQDNFFFMQKPVMEQWSLQK